MTNQQLEQANLMHESGIKWELVAAYFKLSTDTLRKQLKTYAKTNPEIHSTIGEG